MEKEFDFEKAVQELLSGKKLTGKDRVLTPLIKELVETALEAEIISHLNSKHSEGKSNRRNGYNKKTIKSSSGSFELSTPRDRNGEFEPQIVKKHQTTLSDEIEGKILSMYGLGMSYNDISSHIAELYGINVSPAAISEITDKIIDKVKEWQQRPLESFYPFIWLDAIHYKIRENGRYVSKAVYTVIGVNIRGIKEVLGLYINDSEEANFCLWVLTDFKTEVLKIYS